MVMRFFPPSLIRAIYGVKSNGHMQIGIEYGGHILSLACSHSSGLKAATQQVLKDLHRGKVVCF